MLKGRTNQFYDVGTRSYTRRIWDGFLYYCFGVNKYKRIRPENYTVTGRVNTSPYTVSCSNCKLTYTVRRDMLSYDNSYICNDCILAKHKFVIPTTVNAQDHINED